MYLLSFHVHLLSLLLLLSACELWIPSTAKGLRKTPLGHGPKVIYDLHTHSPMSVPFPNDDLMYYTRQTTSKQLLHLQPIFLSSTILGQNLQNQLNQIDAFPIHTPITVRFDQAIDIKDLWSRHNIHDPSNQRYRDDFRDDAIYLFNVDPTCQRYGEEIALDLGRGRFPITSYSAHASLSPDSTDKLSTYTAPSSLSGLLFDFTKLSTHYNLLFATQSKHGSSLLHPLSCKGLKQNDLNDTRCIADQITPFYERASHSLILKPVWPLEAGCHHAVVLTNRLKGENGHSVRSPFSSINPQRQTPILNHFVPWLARYHMSIDQVAFAWSFTTKDHRDDLQNMRAGLYGQGNLKQWKQQFSPHNIDIWTDSFRINQAIQEYHTHSDTHNSTDHSQNKQTATPLIEYITWSHLYQKWAIDLCTTIMDLVHIDAWFAGHFYAPNLMFTTKSVSQNIEKTPSTPVTFWCTLPIEKEFNCDAGNPQGLAFCKPFPTIIYLHDDKKSRSDVLRYAGRASQMGYAMCAVDLYAHGGNQLLHQWQQSVIPSFELEHWLSDWYQDVLVALLQGRDVHELDSNNHAHHTHHAIQDWWSTDLITILNLIRQSVVEIIQFVRILRSFDGVEFIQGSQKLLGDIDQDGIIDLAGPHTSITLWGSGLGAMISTILSGVEPRLNAVVAHAGASSWIESAMRLGPHNMMQNLWYSIMGPFVVGCLPTDHQLTPLKHGQGNSCFTSSAHNQDDQHDESPTFTQLQAGEMELAFALLDQGKIHYVPFAKIPHVSIGDWIQLENQSNGEIKQHKVSKDGKVLLSVASDAQVSSTLNHVNPHSSLTVNEPHLWVIKHFKNYEMVPGDIKEIPPSQADPSQADLTQRVADYQIDRLQWEITFQKTTYAKNSPLMALQSGLGLEANTPHLRVFAHLAQLILAPVEPATWTSLPSNSQHAQNHQSTLPYILYVPIIGDQVIPISSGITLARYRGLLGNWKRDTKHFPDPRYGWREIFQPVARSPQELNGDEEASSIDQQFIDRFVIEGDPLLRRYPSTMSSLQNNSYVFRANPSQSEMLSDYTLFDIDNLSDGKARFTCDQHDELIYRHQWLCPSSWKQYAHTFVVPHDPLGMRLTFPYPNGYADALRLPLLHPSGQHTLYNAQPFRVFDHDSFMLNFIIRYLGNGGKSTTHESGCDCSLMQDLSTYEMNLSDLIQQEILSCEEQKHELKSCDQTCIQAWGF